MFEELAKSHFTPQTTHKEEMTELVLLDAVGAPAWAFNQLVLIVVLSPFVVAFGFILLFKLLDKYSSQKRTDIVTPKQPVRKT